MKIALYLSFLLIFLSCSSAGNRVIARMNEASERPKWASLAKTVFAKDGRIWVVGFTEGNVNARISAILKVSDNAARFEIAREVSDDMNFIYQNIEEGVGEGGQLSRFYGSEVSKFLGRGIRQERRYWEKVQTLDSEGEPAFKLHVYSLISMKESDLRKAIRSAINEKANLTPKIKQQIVAHMVHEIQQLMTEY